MWAHVAALTVFEGLLRANASKCYFYVNLCFLDDNGCMRANFPTGDPRRKRQKRCKHQTSHATSAVLYARQQGLFAETVLY